MWGAGKKNVVRNEIAVALDNRERRVRDSRGLWDGAGSSEHSSGWNSGATKTCVTAEEALGSQEGKCSHSSLQDPAAAGQCGERHVTRVPSSSVLSCHVERWHKNQQNPNPGFHPVTQELGDSRHVP